MTGKNEISRRPADRLLYGRLTGLLLRTLVRWGYKRQLATGTTSRVAYRAMRKLYGNTNPRQYESLVERAAAERSLLEIDTDPTGLAAGEVAETVERLQRDGLALLSTLLDKEACDDLETIARIAECDLRDGVGDERRRWDEAAPQAIRYDVPEAKILESRAAQRLAADRSLLAVAQGYLGAAPVQDLVAMWWSAAMGPEASSEAAQLFHFDLDRIRFVKVFVLLTDVDTTNGPHIYVRGSHVNRPRSLRRDGRYDDAVIEAAFPGSIETVTGPRGTVFLADTSGFHKGLVLERGHRLIFQTEYATSLFGAPYERQFVENPTPELRSSIDRYPWTFQRLSFAPPRQPTQSA